MRNLKLEIEYDGKCYCGWQAQGKSTGKRSIQGTIEKTLRDILHEKVKLIVSGRTDSGVHAEAQVANFKTRSKIGMDRLRGALNALLPRDISISEVVEEKAGFHSRFDAKSKIYRYTILNRPYPSALLRNRAYFCFLPLDVKLMQKEAKALLGKHDFKSFQARDDKKRGSVRAIKSIQARKKGDLITIDIEGDGFLYNMVRNIVGTLIEIGRGRFAAGSMKKILLSRNRSYAGPTVPAKGLCLVKVKY